MRYQNAFDTGKKSFNGNENSMNINDVDLGHKCAQVIQINHMQSTKYLLWLLT